MSPSVSPPFPLSRVLSILRVGCTLWALPLATDSLRASDLLTGVTPPLIPSVTLAWDANPEPDVIGYRLHYGTASGEYTSLLDVGRVTTFALPGLEAGATYFAVITAYNSAGLESLPSTELVFEVPPRIQNTAPVVALHLQDGETIRFEPADLALEAIATDSDGMIVQVEFFEGDRSLGAATEAPWSLEWANIGAGSYVVTAVAHDNAGATATSAPLAVVVLERPAPTLSLQWSQPTAGSREPKRAILEVKGLVGESVRVEYSENLAEWFLLETVEIRGEEGVRLIDGWPDTESGRRFYQLKTEGGAP